MPVLRLTAKACDITGDEQVIGIKNISASSVALPDIMEVNLSTSGWTPIAALPDGCPSPLPPGSACAIVGDLSDIETELNNGETYSVARLKWSDDSYTPHDATLPLLCSI